MRIALVVLSLAVAGWLAVQLSGVRAQDELERIAFGPGAPPSQERVDALIDRADRLNPDLRPALFRAVIAMRAEDFARATAVLQEATRAEPENVEAWALLARAAAEVDPQAAAAARARQRALAPPVPPAP